MRYELQIVTTLQKTVKKRTTSKDLILNKIFDLDRVEIEEFLDPRTGKVVKKFTGMYQGDTYFKVNKPYNELKELILNRYIPVKGLAAKSKRWR